MAGTDDQLALLSSITGSELSACRAALVNAKGDINLAAQLLLSDASVTTDGLLFGDCSECHETNVAGYFGQGSDAETFYCQSCWSRWDGVGHMQDMEQENMLQRDLGLLEAPTLDELGQALLRRVAENWRSPLDRTENQFAWNATGKESWNRVARAAATALASKAGVMASAASFLAGAVQMAGEDLWKLLTIYEIQVASQLPRTSSGAKAMAKAAGCTGLACPGILGQTEEVDVYIYDYGKLDVIFRLRSDGMPASALLYDPACTMCPIGIGVSGLCASRFTLYPQTEASGVGGLPLAAVLWELLLGPRNLPEAVAFLRSLFDGRKVVMASGAALLLTQPGHGMVMVEWSRNKIHISPEGFEGVLVHANHCALGSSLKDEDHRSISRLLEASKRRQSKIEELYAEKLLAGTSTLSLGQVQAFLSAEGIQNDDVLATVISCPEKRELHVRFRLQVSGMEMVEDTLALFFENLHKYKAIPGDLGLLSRAKVAADQLRSLQKVYSDSLKGVKLANAVAQELEDWSKVAAPELEKAEAEGQSEAKEEKLPQELSKKDKKRLKKEKKREKKAKKAEKKAAKTLAKIEEAAKEAEHIAKLAGEEEAEAARRIAEVEEELAAAEAAAAAAEESSSEDPEMVAKAARLREQLNEAYEHSANVALKAAEKAQATVKSKKRARLRLQKSTSHPPLLGIVRTTDCQSQLQIIGKSRFQETVLGFLDRRDGPNAAGGPCKKLQAMAHGRRSWAWRVLAFVALPELASAFIEEIFQQFGAGGGQQFHFQMGDGNVFEMGGGCLACHSDPGGALRWVQTSIDYKSVTWVTQVGFRKNHERSDPQCRLHGVIGRGTGARPNKADASPEEGGLDLPSTAEPKKVLFKTRRGLHLQFDPEPSLDRWISCEVRFNAKTGKYTTPKGELSVAQQAAYEQYQNRHMARCRVGDVADKLTRIVDKYLPKVADENRVFIMRFPNKASQLLKKARRIRRRIKAEIRRDVREKQVQTPAGEVQKQRARKEKPGRSSRRGTTKQKTTEENAEPDPAPPPQKQGKLSQRVTNEREEDSPPDWGDDLPDTMTEDVEPPAAMVPPVEDNTTSTWPWGKVPQAASRSSMGTPTVTVAVLLPFLDVAGAPLPNSTGDMDRTGASRLSSTAVAEYITTAQVTYLKATINGKLRAAPTLGPVDRVKGVDGMVELAAPLSPSGMVAVPLHHVDEKRPPPSVPRIKVSTMVPPSSGATYHAEEGLVREGGWVRDYPYVKFVTLARCKEVRLTIGDMIALTEDQSRGDWTLVDDKDAAFHKEDMQDISLHVHQLAVGEHPGKKSGLALLLPEEVPVGAWSFSLLPPGHEQPILAKVKPATPGCPILLTSQQWEDLKVWTQLCLEIARCDRSCPLHQCFGQTMLTLWKDRSGKWLPAERTEVQSDKDLPERSFWLLAPLASADEESAKISWSCLSWALAALAQFRESSSWLSMPRTWLGKFDPALPEMALDEAVVLGPMPTSSRGSDVKGLCIDLEVKAGEEGAAIFTGYKFSRAAVNAAIDPEFAKVHRNLQQERLELELKAEDCELMPLTSGALRVLRCLPSLLWRLEFVALMQEMPLLCDGLLQTALPSALGEAMTHSKVLSLPFQPSHPQWSKRFCYERMELMGDAVLKLMACTHAAAALPKASEGQLSSVAQWCETNKWLRQVNEKTIQVGSYLLLESFRPKERLSKLRQGRVPQKVAADAVEAAIGAVFGCAAGAISEWKIFRILVQQGPSTENESMDIKAAIAAPPCQNFQAAAVAGLQTSLNLDAGTDAHAAEQVKNAFGYSFRILTAVSPTNAYLLVKTTWEEQLRISAGSVSSPLSVAELRKMGEASTAQAAEPVATGDYTTDKNSKRPLSEYVPFETKEGMALLFHPSPLDKWIGKHYKWDSKHQHYVADKLVKLVGKCDPAVEEELRIYIGKFPGEVRHRTAELRHDKKDKAEKVKTKKKQKSKKEKKKEGKKKKKHKKPAKENKHHTADAGDSSESHMTEDVEHRAMANPSPEEKDMGDPNKTHKTENAQYHAAASSTPEEVDWGDEDDETELHTAQNTATNSGGSDSDTENAPTAASEAFVHLNWHLLRHSTPPNTQVRVRAQGTGLDRLVSLRPSGVAGCPQRLYWLDDSFQFLLPGDDTIHHIDNSLDREDRSAAFADMLEANTPIARAKKEPSRDRGNPKLLAALRASSTGARSVGFQRLEFLGDAVLLVCVCCHLMQVCSDFDEGQLSQALQAFICNKYLSRKLIRRFGEVRSFASVFFPRQTSPQRVHLPSQFDEVLASEVETDYVIGVRNVEAPGHKCVADGYEAMIAAVLLDTGGDLGETWAVFAKDFEVPSRAELAELLRPRPRHEDHLHLDGSEKEEQTAKSSGLDAAVAPEFGQPEGEGRRLLLDHCRRHGLKLRFEVKESGAVAEVRVRCVVGGRFLPEACGASMRQAQDLAAEAALWELTRRSTQSDAKFPPPSLPESLRPGLTDFPQVDFEQSQRPKGIARQELQRYCNRNGLQHRFVESEEEDVDHTVIHRMRVAAGDRIFPP
ncbi:rnc, partial [Symbiodinium sp. KB8]